MAQRNAPGSCADCGNDAYIRLASTNGIPDMVCAHCFAERVRSGAVKPEKAHTKVMQRTEQDHRIRR